ncbi:Leucyl aminopeptidase [Mycena chlorophos]|uniref:Aminopeptidase n=1 Tax=Mycena chlorophos TaxID=658473 RepID=A0A8H6TB61_MYCCL|nr:Leucyl aminopeptidase [Mycena chlorophos]
MSEYRLPTAVRPRAYELTLWTDLENATFGGFVLIKLDVVEETSVVVLNCSSDLQVSKASIALGEGLSHTPVSVVDKGPERLTLGLPSGSLLSPQTKAELKVAFNAPLRGSMNGYYKSAWKHDGKTEYYALTQFQPTDARAAFPCFDEPALKARFTITMISRPGTVSLSNMPVASEGAYAASSSDGFLEVPAGEWKVTTFEETPLMSTYIVAFANGPFEFMEEKVQMPLSGRTIPLRVYATPDIIHQAGFCLSLSAKVLPLYEKLFRVEFPLPKLDTLAAHDFDMGAMENFGLITGRTRAFLADPKKNDIGSQKLIAKIQSHEISHMWFGNLVTMEWWDYLYLNEGFASLMGDVISIDKIFPDWDAEAAFLIRRTSDAMFVDGKRSSHPIEVPCPDVAFLNQIFDGLSYSKAAAVLRMLSNFVGEDKFLEGVSIYLKKHIYGNTVSGDLWAGISTAAGYDVGSMMSNWVKKIGYPVLTVTESANGITVQQNRFLDNGKPTPEENETIWTIPLAIRSVGDDGKARTDNGAVLSTREAVFEVDTGRPFKLNADAFGVYRVLYTPERLSKIAAEAAKPDSMFSLSDRMGLLYDVAALSNAGFLPVSSLLDMVYQWREEKSHMVWSTAWSNLARLGHVFWEYPAIIDGLRELIRTLFEPMITRLGFEFPEGEAVATIELRKIALAACLRGNVESVAQYLHGQFIAYMDTGDESVIPAEILRNVFTAAAKYGGRREFDALLGLVENGRTPAIKTGAIVGLGYTQDPALLDELFAYMVTKARDQDVASFCRGLQLNPAARRPLAKFCFENYAVFAERFGTNSTLKYFVEECFCRMTAQSDYDEIEAFFKDKDTSRYSMVLAQVLETIESYVVTIERSKDELTAWFVKWEQTQK